MSHWVPWTSLTLSVKPNEATAQESTFKIWLKKVFDYRTSARNIRSSAVSWFHWNPLPTFIEKRWVNRYFMIFHRNESTSIATDRWTTSRSQNTIQLESDWARILDWCVFCRQTQNNQRFAKSTSIIYRQQERENSSESNKRSSSRIRQEIDYEEAFSRGTKSDWTIDFARIQWFYDIEEVAAQSIFELHETIRNAARTFNLGWNVMRLFMQHGHIRRWKELQAVQVSTSSYSEAEAAQAREVKKIEHADMPRFHLNRSSSG